uniref:Uncharacterized protein n=1 Tax=Spermophilus dauricus TaxID=99837 RepID=A0A8C9PZK0_SPEDA
MPSTPKKSTRKEIRVDNRWPDTGYWRAAWARSGGLPIPLLHAQRAPTICSAYDKQSQHHPARAQEQRTVSGSWTTRGSHGEVFPQLLLCLQPNPTRAVCGQDWAGTTAQASQRCYGKGKPSSCITSSTLGTWLGQCLVSQPPNPLPLDMVNDDQLKKLASTCHTVPNSWPSWRWEPLKHTQRVSLTRCPGALHRRSGSHPHPGHPRTHSASRRRSTQAR